ncbi:hypothetical protein B0H14DRAFT_3440475 [Mycena olivaceomarginata]|nr:hypothetical protein B0H14DRAFT_3440475 [Mycena olivaceomarginata]
MALASLADLPDELLVDIFEHPTVPTEALYFLALLCRRLHLVALTIYFSRNGVDLGRNSATISLGTDQWDTLSALQICLFVSSMEDLSCVFPHPGCTTILPVVTQMKRLQTFVSRLSPVATVTLNLDPTGHGRSRCLSTGTDKDLKEWAGQYGALLTCIVQKGCRSLTVINGGHVFFLHLTSLHLNSATLLVPPGLDWTLSALRNCPVTSLTICMSRIGGYTRLWRRVLPLMASAAPNLTAVALLEVARHSEAAALAFVAWLPHLTDLHLDFIVADHLLSRAGVNPELLRAIQSIILASRAGLSPYITLSVASTALAHVLMHVTPSTNACFRAAQSVHIDGPPHDGDHVREWIGSFLALFPSASRVSVVEGAIPAAEVARLVQGTPGTGSLEILADATFAKERKTMTNNPTPMNPARLVCAFYRPDHLSSHEFQAKFADRLVSLPTTQKNVMKYFTQSYGWHPNNTLNTELRKLGTLAPEPIIVAIVEAENEDRMIEVSQCLSSEPALTIASSGWRTEKSNPMSEVQV